MVSVRPLEDNAASENGIAALTPLRSASRRSTASGIVLVLVTSTSGVSRGPFHGPGSATEKSPSPPTAPGTAPGRDGPGWDGPADAGPTAAGPDFRTTSTLL